MTKPQFFLSFIATVSLSLLVLASEPLPEQFGPEDVGAILDNFPVDPTQEEALRFIFQLEPYEPDRFEGLMHSDFYSVAGTSDIADACLTLLEDDRFQNYWTESLHALGIMASMEPEHVDFQRLTGRLIEVENSDLPTGVVMSTLRIGYIAVGRFGIEKSEEFLAPRMKESFWEEKRRLEQNWAPAGMDPEIVTPRHFAIRSFNVLGEIGGIERLRALLSEELERGDAFVDEAVRTVEINTEIRRRTHGRRTELYREWQERQPEPDEETEDPDRDDEPADYEAPLNVLPESENEMLEPDSGTLEESQETGGRAVLPWTIGGVAMLAFLAFAAFRMRSRPRNS